MPTPYPFRNLSNGALFELYDTYFFFLLRKSSTSLPFTLFSHFRPLTTLGNSFFQMWSYAHAYVRITYEKKQRDNSLENITWSEMGKQNVQAKGVNYCQLRLIKCNSWPLLIIHKRFRKPYCLLDFLGGQADVVGINRASYHCNRTGWVELQSIA